MKSVRDENAEPKRQLDWFKRQLSGTKSEKRVEPNSYQPVTAYIINSHPALQQGNKTRNKHSQALRFTTNQSAMTVIIQLALVVARPISLGLLLLMATAHFALAAVAIKPEQVPDYFIELLTGESDAPTEYLNRIDANWDNSMVPMAIESIRFSNSQPLTSELLKILVKHTGQDFSRDIDAWWRWWWAQPEQRHPHYATFKSQLYSHLDPLFAGYFNIDRVTTERLDEIRWGGVRQDGIPPLRQPAMVAGAKADYLADSDVVFGIEINGDARAYPQRILAWHEMFVDTVGGVDFAGVYCTLCGAVILYETTHNGVEHAMGTSGFLFRSNKVMYDKATQSLWSTTRGEPIVGPLVGKGIQLQRSYLVTTTWGEWRERHPETSVLSLDTGFQRNYDEGIAYKDYFSTDRLMFTVPKSDNRLANKAEVLALYFPQQSDKTLAISADFLSSKPVYHHSVGPQKLVVLTDGSGANRVYDATKLQIKSFDGKHTAVDAEGNEWLVTEAALESTDGTSHKRLPAHRAFWFGWNAAFNDTELVK